MGEANNADRLMNVLITKMEDMDGNINALREENLRLRKMVSNPTHMLKKMGLVRSTTPLTEDVRNDPFRNDMNPSSIMKGDNSSVPLTNEAFHDLSWDDIHEMAQNVKDVTV
jgi:hypothetical protein|tara:strand:- start:1553 stop:1888 length:336 start_codon:yes stop_codon:yes gene_type:complete